MGYSTEFNGELKFKNELTASELSEVKKFLGNDCRDHPEWGEPDLYYVDLEFLDDFSGLKWDGAEKTYGMIELVNMITRNMRGRLQYAGFGFTGELFAQGEDYDDRWKLVIDNEGIAKKREVVIVGDTVVCPHCESKFFVEKDQD